MERIVLGEAEIIRVREWQGPFAAARDVVPGVAEDVWQENASWLAPDHYDPETGAYKVALQSWVIRHGGRTVLVDTGVGADRERPGTPQFHRRPSDFPAHLAAAGIKPEDVDVVVNTHLHSDHIGWNTVDRDGTWEPFFPNAEYLLPAADHARLEAVTDPGDNRHLMFADSVLPVLRAGRARLWEGAHRIDDALTLEAAPGHTPGSAVLRLESRGERAVFVGDLLHSPVQLLHPSCNSCFCEDPAQAAATRRRVLEQAADRRELLVPAHFGGSGALEVRRTGPAFEVSRWTA
ncbi:MBL fold metallo-hydrolase [Kitasatospora sp. NPDC004240]